MNLEQSLEKLFSLHQFGIKLGLDKPKALFSSLGNPQNELNCFHIAGSNAKGSVASFINSILIEQGYKVGLYTSPHFIKFNERIRINGEMIEDNYVLNFMNRMDDYITKNEPTFFELTTAMAFKYFQENNVDYAVIETGLGGRLDATNVINPIASVITTISLEHTNILGNTIEQIAYEKGEIIKSGGKVITGILPEPARQVIENKANKFSAEHFSLQDVLSLEKDFVKIQLKSNTLHLYKTPLHGVYQLRNAALAIYTVINSIRIKEHYSIFRGVDNVINNSGIQGRYEVYNEFPKVIFDSSHNEEGILNFINEFKSESSNFQRREVIFGVMKDKDIKKMLKKFDNIFDEIYSTTFDYERAATIEQITEIAESIGVNAVPVSEPHEYIREFIGRKSNDCLVVLGSIYMLGQIKTKLMKENT